MTLARHITTIALIIAPVVAAAEHNYDRARVVDVKPQYKTVSYTVPTEQCRVERVRVDYDDRRYAHRRSYTAPIVGAIIGGAVGNAVGHSKTNKKVGTAVGAVLGASIGADVARRNAQGRYYPQHASYRDEQVCEVVEEVRQERQISEYRVKYSYAGETYVTYMDRDPGRYLRVRVQVTPV